MEHNKQNSTALIQHIIGNYKNIIGTSLSLMEVIVMKLIIHEVKKLAMRMKPIVTNRIMNTMKGLIHKINIMHSVKVRVACSI